MIPLSTTTISVLRLPAASKYDEPYSSAEPAGRSAVASGIPAVIDHAGGNTQIAGGVQAIEDYQLVCDYTEIIYLDLIADDTTGKTFRLTWLMPYPDHIEAGLRAVEGEV